MWGILQNFKSINIIDEEGCSMDMGPHLTRIISAAQGCIMYGAISNLSRSVTSVHNGYGCIWTDSWRSTNIEPWAWNLASRVSQPQIESQWTKVLPISNRVGSYCILSYHKGKKSRCLYLVMWKGYPITEDCWEPERISKMLLWSSRITCAVSGPSVMLRGTTPISDLWNHRK